MQDSTENTLLTRAEAAHEFGLTKRYLELLAAKGEGPRMLRLSSRMVRYRRRNIVDWIEANLTGDAVDGAGKRYG